MARLQILELPEGADDEHRPFLLIIDQVDDELADEITRWPDNIATRVGARHALCFPGTIDIPANEAPTGTDTVLVGCEQHEARIAELATALREVLDRFVHDTHPGRRCKQTDHVNVETITGWWAVLGGEAIR